MANGALSLLGKGIGSLITGFGDYKIEGNSLMTGGIDPPTVVNTVNNGGVIIRHREYLQDINASTPFNILTFPINPGQRQTFPWLSSIAAHFEQYKFRGLLFEFKSLSSDAVLSSATSSALGSIVMATQYNALNPAFINKFVMENYEFANSSKPSLSFIHPVECNRADTSIVELYTRTGAPAVGSDLRLYDLGNFSIAAVGMQATSGVAGELWCTYEIEFLKPKIEDISDSTEQVDHFHIAFGATGTTLFNGAILDTSSTLNGSITSPLAYSFPPAISQGRYIMFMEINGPSTLTAAGTRFLTNCVSVNEFTNNSQPRITTVGTVASMFDVICVDVTAANASVSYVGMTIPFPAMAGDLFVIEVPGNLMLPPKKTIIQDDYYGDDDPYQDDEQELHCMIRDLHAKLSLLKL